MRLKTMIGGTLSEQAQALFSTFDGFEAEMADHDTMVCIWSADAICRRVAVDPSDSKGQVFGDYFLSANLLRCDLRCDLSKVWWDEDGRIAADSLLDFCRQVGSGSFEF